MRERRTERLRLRALSEDDLPSFLALQTDPRATAHRPSGPSTVEEARRDLETYARIWKEHGVGYWAVELEGTFVGVAGIRPVELAGRAVWNVFYRFFPTVWGRGYALEAVREAVAVAESVAVERPIVALTLPANTASIRVAERAGLVRRPELDRDGHVAFARGW